MEERMREEVKKKKRQREKGGLDYQDVRKK